MGNVEFIPEMSREEILRRYSHIKPIVKSNGEKWFLRELNEDELYMRKYIWQFNDYIEKKVDFSIYVPSDFAEFDCYHKYNFYGSFKPCVAEVLSQISKNVEPFVDAFEIIDYPNVVNEAGRRRIIADKKYHVSTIKLYTSKNNPNVIFM